MALRAVEVIALIFVIIALIKLLVILVNKNKWYENVVKPIYSGSGTWAVVFLLLAIIVFYYLLKELSIVQIFAVMAFTSLLMGIGFMKHGKEMIEFAKKTYHKKTTFWGWIYIIIWLILLLWALFKIL